LNRISKYAFVLFIFLLVIFASGCITNNNPANNTSQAPNTSQSRANNSSFASDVVVTVAYQGTWNGTLSDNTGTRTIQGTANNIYNLGPNPGAVSINIQKTGNDNLPLTVQILRGSNVIETSTTTAQNGTISLNYTFH
jgi:hypothetical protein